MDINWYLVLVGIIVVILILFYVNVLNCEGCCKRWMPWRYKEQQKAKLVQPMMNVQLPSPMNHPIAQQNKPSGSSYQDQHDRLRQEYAGQMDRRVPTGGMTPQPQKSSKYSFKDI